LPHSPYLQAAPSTSASVGKPSRAA
jgi:hypothetical protein